MNRVLCCALLCWLLEGTVLQGANTLPANQSLQLAAAVFEAPKGWSVESRPDIVILESPEQDTRLALAVQSSVSPQIAVQSAWRTLAWHIPPAPKLITEESPDNGWQEHLSFAYDEPSNQRRSVAAGAYRNGQQWFVLLFDGSAATAEKRDSQISLVRESLHPKGFERESFLGRKPLPLTPQRINTIRRFLQNGMQELGVPGASLALLDQGHVVYEGGIGVRKLGDPAPVDENTHFLAASLTKGMTTLLLARLVDEGKINWDEPVIDVLPMFKLGDSAMTHRILVRHLVCACTGLPRQDLEWEFEYKHATPLTMLRLLGGMQPTSQPGELFQYSNLMAAVAGYAAARVYDPKRDIASAYYEAMQNLVFNPLGMKSTTFDFDAVQKENFASPHGDNIDGKPTLADIASNYAIVPLAPAGGAWTTAHDLSRYVQLELAQGKLPDGTQLVSRKNLLIRRQPGVSRSAYLAYGMGLSVNTEWGVSVVRHGGSMDGYKSELFFIPDANVGAVLLTNADNGDMLSGPLLRRVLEVIYNGAPKAQNDLDLEIRAHRQAVEKTRKELVLPPDSIACARLAPSYANGALGRIDVVKADSKVTFDFGEWKSDVATRKNSDGSISFVTIDPTVSGFEFVASTRDGKKALILRDSQHEYVFLDAHR